MGNCQMMVDHCINVQDIKNDQQNSPQKPSQSYRNYDPYLPQSWYAQPLEQKDVYPLSENTIKIIKQSQDIVQHQSYERGKPVQEYYFIKQLNLCYKGQWNRGRPQGKGQIIFKNGSYLKGFFYQGLCNSKDCLFIDKIGSIYRGGMKKSLFSGQGTYQTKNYKYQGNWQNGHPHGQGVQQFIEPNGGAIYKGNFIQGIKSGANCQYIWKNHKIYDRYQGCFENDWFSGSGNLVKKNSDVIHGDFDGNIIRDASIINNKYQFRGQIINGLMQGQGTLKFLQENNIEYSGGFKAGQMHGKGMFKYPNKQSEQVYFHKGKLLKQCRGFDQKDTEKIIQIVYLQDACQSIEKQLQTRQRKKFQVSFEKQKEVKSYQSKIKREQQILIPIGEYIIAVRN